jgi:MFS-type transporter involved in bile tolerance (Atg22 family)
METVAPVPESSTIPPSSTPPTPLPSSSSPPPWKPDLVHRILDIGHGGPKVPALVGYYLHKIIYSLMIVHSGVVFAGVLTYEALEVAGCLPDSNDDDGAKCKAQKNDDDTLHCKNLWGLIKPDSLLTVIATGAAIVLAISSIFMGTVMDITKYRRQIGIIGTVICILSITLCLAIINPNETTIAICSLGLFLLFIFKDLHFLVIESYVPEISQISSELSHAISVASAWLYGGEVIHIILWIIVGFFVTGSLYGFIVTIGTVILMCLYTPFSYYRLPNVPAVLTLPPNTSLYSYTLTYQYQLFLEIHSNFPDLGIVLAANMLYDPALNALFIAAIQVLVSKFHFTSSQIPIILGVGIICATIGAYLCKYSIYLDPICCVHSSLAATAAAANATSKTSPAPPPPPHGRSSPSEQIHLPSELSPEVHCEGEHGDEDPEANGNSNGAFEKGFSIVELSGMGSPGFEPLALPPSTLSLQSQSSLTMPSSSTRYLVANRLKHNIMFGLLSVIVITLCGTFLMKPCDLTLACGFGALWGISLAYCWTSGNLLRATLIPGGKEGQFAGLLVSTGNLLSWLPLLIFSIANEVWTIEGAMVTLTGFFLLGIIILSFCVTDRGVTAALNTLSNRRWVPTHSNHHLH